ncbi:nuclear nucleic acid-binding protein C1D-like [Nymphalis io]|uniref:nuclear nucleic acid-binding protein C1D-like n=1 Tax=Inachis io TaxID=171585 RepID=UPI002169B045|nr:nuclear nucleic acid-binding protein C1D-like [Nymphalis io]
MEKVDWNLEYGELAKDKDFVNKYESLKNNLIELEHVLEKLLPLRVHYDKMCLPAQIELDLFLAFTMNSLYWVQLRVQGVDPTTHPIKDELARIKSVMVKWQEVKDKEKRPTVDLEAAKRFVRSGLYDPYRAIGQPANKKKKFNDEDMNE